MDDPFAELEVQENGEMQELNIRLKLAEASVMITWKKIIVKRVPL